MDKLGVADVIQYNLKLWEETCPVLPSWYRLLTEDNVLCLSHRSADRSIAIRVYGEADSKEYNLLVQWIEQGMPYGGDSDPLVTGIRCVPETRTMTQKANQQIAVIATYSDGSTEDVTRIALFEPNEA